VGFFDTTDANFLTNVNVDTNGMASLMTATLVPGPHTIVAVYLGDSNFAGVTNSSGRFEVQATAPGITCAGDLLVTNAVGSTQTLVGFTPVASGVPTPDVICTLRGLPIVSPYSFPKGTNLVTCIASNIAGATNCSFTVTVVEGGPSCLLVWKFDEASGLTALDSSGNNNPGVLLNGPVRTNGVVGAALRFDGSNDRVQTANGSSLNITSAFTIACWVRPESVSEICYLVVNGNDANDRYA